MTTTTTCQLEARAVAGLLGVAVGDALGATVEFMTPAAIRARHGVHDTIIGGGSFGWRPGQGTDDTDLTWAVTSAYIDGYTLTRAADEMAAWYRTGPRDIGATTAQALTTYVASGDATSSGLTCDRSAGNGSLMRCLPTAVARVDPTVRAFEAAEISGVTHAEPRCVDACIAYINIAAALLEGADPATALAAAAARPGLHPQVLAALDPTGLSVTDLDTSGYVIASLTCAAWAISQPRPAHHLLVDLVNRGDDADTTAAIAGGLLGLRDGADAWPTAWTDTLEYHERLIDAAPRLLALRHHGSRS